MYFLSLVDQSALAETGFDYRTAALFLLEKAVRSRVLYAA